MQSHGESTTSVIREDVTVYVAIELSAKSWVVGLKTPGSDKIGLHVLKPSDACGLGALIERYREDASERAGSAARVLVAMKRVSRLFCPRLDGEGFETIVLDPSSLLVNRKARQRKTDRIDARKMVRALLAHDRGDAHVLSRVRVPSVAE